MNYFYKVPVQALEACMDRTWKQKRDDPFHSWEKLSLKHNALTHLCTCDLPDFSSVLCPVLGTHCSRPDNAKEMPPGPFFGFLVLFNPMQPTQVQFFLLFTCAAD